MRVYVPGHIDQREFYLSGAWEPARGFAVTPALRDISANDDLDELSEVPRDAAAHASMEDEGSPLRLVIVVDYPRADAVPVAGEHPATVALTGKVMPEVIVCAFVDEPQAAAAKETLMDRELLWYDATEILSIPTP